MLNEIENQKLYREINVDYDSFKNDEKSDQENFEFFKIKKILKELKLLFEKRGYQINWKDLEGQNVYQTLSGLSMASIIFNSEKQILLEAKSLSERTTKFEEILNTYSSEFSNIDTLQ